MFSFEIFAFNLGRDSLTHNMLENMHAHWKRRRDCKIKCKGVCTIECCYGQCLRAARSLFVLLLLLLFKIGFSKLVLLLIYESMSKSGSVEFA